MIELLKKHKEDAFELDAFVMLDELLMDLSEEKIKTEVPEEDIETAFIMCCIARSLWDTIRFRFMYVLHSFQCALTHWVLDTRHIAWVSSIWLPKSTCHFRFHWPYMGARGNSRLDRGGHPSWWCWWNARCDTKGGHKGSSKGAGQQGCASMAKDLSAGSTDIEKQRHTDTHLAHSAICHEGKTSSLLPPGALWIHHWESTHSFSSASKYSLEWQGWNQAYCRWDTLWSSQRHVWALFPSWSITSMGVHVEQMVYSKSVGLVGMVCMLKTTMVVESLWRQMKCQNLPQFNQPRLDLVTHVVLKFLLPQIKWMMDYLHGQHCIGRPQSLASWQECFKKDWHDMTKPDKQWLIKKELDYLKNMSIKPKIHAEWLAKIRAEETWPWGVYHTYIEDWACSCPSYLISHFLLCKHLVHEANKKTSNTPLHNLRFFLDLKCNHYPPYYSIPGIHRNMAGEDIDNVETTEVHMLLLGRSRRQAYSCQVSTSSTFSSPITKDMLR